MRQTMRDQNGNPRLAVFDSNGFWGGLALGGLIGAMAAGPHLGEWSFLTSMGTICGVAFATGLMGYAAIAVFAGSVAAGAAVSDDDMVDHGADDECRVGGLSFDD